MGWTGRTAWLSKVPTIVKVISLIFLIGVALTSILSSEYSVKWIARRMAHIAKTIANTYKEHGIDETEVKGSVNLGFMKYEVVGID